MLVITDSGSIRGYGVNTNKVWGIINAHNINPHSLLCQFNMILRFKLLYYVMYMFYWKVIMTSYHIFYNRYIET